MPCGTAQQMAFAKWRPTRPATVNPAWRNWDTCELYKPRVAFDFGRDPFRVLMLGLDAAGKTTILYKLFGEPDTTIPTIGFNVETTKPGTAIGNQQIETLVWDVGGRDKIRPLWRHYFQTVQAFIWVVDSNDNERLAHPDYDHSSKYEFYKLVQEDELRGRPILVIANKQDLPGAMTPDDVAAAFELPINTGFGSTATAGTADSKSYVAKSRKELSELLDSVLSDALPVAPLRGIVLSYCSFDSPYVRVVGMDASSASKRELSASYEWLIRAIYQRSGKEWTGKPPSSGFGGCTIM